MAQSAVVETNFWHSSALVGLLLLICQKNIGVLKVLTTDLMHFIIFNNFFHGLLMRINVF